MTIEQLATIVAQQGTKLDQLAKEMRAGFATINKRIDKLESKVDNVITFNNLES
jgi:uncharacterized coiled-coil protein SlyX